jgi:hypothetical protein
MEERILIFWLFVYVILWVLRRNPDSIISNVAFSWIGPEPYMGEMYSRFQFRWASYSFSWLCQFMVVLFVLFLLAKNFPALQEQAWFKVLLFALPFGIGIATLATIGFLIKAGKARWFGPNPSFKRDA